MAMMCSTQPVSLQPVHKTSATICWQKLPIVGASHGGSFHAPQEIQRILSHGLDRAMQARLAVSKVLAKNGYTGDVPMPDISTKAKAQEYIGLDMDAERAAKEKFLKITVPAWLEKAKENGRLAQI